MKGYGESWATTQYTSKTGISLRSQTKALLKSKLHRDSRRRSEHAYTKHISRTTLCKQCRHKLQCCAMNGLAQHGSQPWPPSYGTSKRWQGFQRVNPPKPLSFIPKSLSDWDIYYPQWKVKGREALWLVRSRNRSSEVSVILCYELGLAFVISYIPGQPPQRRLSSTCCPAFSYRSTAIWAHPMPAQSCCWPVWWEHNTLPHLNCPKGTCNCTPVHQFQAWNFISEASLITG